MKEYIERAAVLKVLEEYYPGADERLHIVKDITSIPAADVAPVRHGQWEECDYVEPCIHGFGTIRHKAAGLKCINCCLLYTSDAADE